jgi:hypothetical protein
LFYARQEKGAPMLDLKWSGPGFGEEEIPLGVYEVGG